jgi:hypothetical protein
MDKRTLWNEKPIESLKADDVLIGYNPQIDTKMGQRLQSLTLDFHTSKGCVRIRLEGDSCNLFDRRYREHAQGRMKE